VDRVGVGAGDHLIKALNQALTVRLCLGDRLIDVNVHHDLVA
jgi:hypothetical protein